MRRLLLDYGIIWFAALDSVLAMVVAVHGIIWFAARDSFLAMVVAGLWHHWVRCAGLLVCDGFCGMAVDVASLHHLLGEDSADGMTINLVLGVVVMPSLEFI